MGRLGQRGIVSGLGCPQNARLGNARRCYNEPMTTPPQDDSPTVEQLLLLQQQVATLLQGLIDGQKGLTDSLAELSGHQDNQAKAIDLLADLAHGHSEILGGLTEKLDGLTNDIAMVKGGHAVAAMRQNAALIADDLGCQLIEELPQGVVVGFAKVAADDKQPPRRGRQLPPRRHGDVRAGRQRPPMLHCGGGLLHCRCQRRQAGC